MMIAKLVSNGLARDVAELYRLKLAEIAALEDATQESARHFFDAIAASRNCEAWRLLFGLSIPALKSKEAQMLCKHFATVDNVFAAGFERLLQAAISETAARNIVQWHSDSVNRRLVKRLFKAGLNFRNI